MIKLANILDSLGLYKEADNMDKVMVAQFFNLKKKRKSPLQMISNLQQSINTLQQQVSDVSDSMDSSDDGSSSVKVTVDEKLVEFIQS